MQFMIIVTINFYITILTKSYDDDDDNYLE